MIGIAGTSMLAAAQQSQMNTSSAGSVYAEAAVVPNAPELAELAVAARDAVIKTSTVGRTASTTPDLPDAPGLGLGAPTPVHHDVLTPAQSNAAAVSQAPDWILHRPSVDAETTSVAGVSYSDASVYPFSSDPLSSDASSSDSASVAVSPSGHTSVELKDCPYDRTHASLCRMHWKNLAISSTTFLAIQNVANLYAGYWYRQETTYGKWWDRYVNSVEGWRWNVWKDDNPFLDDYIAHPMMGGITNAIWIQNDPKGMTLEQANNWPYWRSRLRATAFSTFYSFEWKLGPIGEAGIGHNGDHYFNEDSGVLTNETGWVELVTTPVGGFVWTLVEDAIDKTVIHRLEQKSSSIPMLIAYQFLNPTRAFANILRFRTPWYRDSRVVKANSFWSDPEADTTPATPTVIASVSSSSAPPLPSSRSAAYPAASSIVAVRMPQTTTQARTFALPGGVHEVGAIWGLSLITGHLWGSAKDIRYMPVEVRYSYLLSLHDKWAFRYAPEITATAMLDEENHGSKDRREQRKRTYGSGLSPVGFQTDFFPRSHVQPFLSTNAGLIYFLGNVLSPQGSHLMYTVDFGTGLNIFRTERQAISIGYRYQHLSNGNISPQNPGTGANTFYLGISRFRTKGSR